MPYVRTIPRRPLQVVSIRYRGMGATASQDVQTAGGIGGSVVSAAAGPGIGAAVGIGASLAVPLVGAAFAGIMLGIQALMNSGCGQTCVLSSQAANQATSLMSQNLHAYLALPAPRSQTAQQAYLSNFDQIWAWLQSVCGQPNLGNAGVRCIQNQMPGTCPLKTSAYGWNNVNGKWVFTEAGPSGSGSTCWNYFSGFRDPIANDPTVVADSVAADASSAAASIGSLFSGSSSMLPLLLIGGFVLAGVFLT